MSTLAEFRTRIEKILIDDSGDTFETAIIDEGLRTAIGYYSRQKPIETNGTLADLSSDGREIDISSVTGLVSISRVWVPYLTTQTQPLYRKFEHWRDDSKINITDYYPKIGEVVRLFYAKSRELSGLDGATNTTLLTEDYPMILEGASAFAIISEATHGVDHVQIDSPTTRSAQLMEIAKYKLTRFYGWLGLDENGMVKDEAVLDNGTSPGGKGIVIKNLFHTDLYSDNPTIPDF